MIVVVEWNARFASEISWQEDMNVIVITEELQSAGRYFVMISILSDIETDVTFIVVACCGGHDSKMLAFFHGFEGELTRDPSEAIDTNDNDIREEFERPPEGQPEIETGELLVDIDIDDDGNNVDEQSPKGHAGLEIGELLVDTDTDNGRDDAEEQSPEGQLHLEEVELVKVLNWFE